MLKHLKISDLRFLLIGQPPKWNSLELTLQKNFIGKILIMRRKLPFIVLAADPWPFFFHLPPLPLERAQARRGACLSLKRLFVSMVTCLLHLQSCNLGNSIKSLSRQLLWKWCQILAICFIHLCCPVILWIWWFCFYQMEEVK